MGWRTAATRAVRYPCMQAPCMWAEHARLTVSAVNASPYVLSFYMTQDAESLVAAVAAAKEASGKVRGEGGSRGAYVVWIAYCAGTGDYRCTAVVRRVAGSSSKLRRRAASGPQHHISSPPDPLVRMVAKQELTTPQHNSAPHTARHTHTHTHTPPGCHCGRRLHRHGVRRRAGLHGSGGRHHHRHARGPPHGATAHAAGRRSISVFICLQSTQGKEMRGVLCVLCVYVCA